MRLNKAMDLKYTDNSMLNSIVNSNVFNGGTITTTGNSIYTWNDMNISSSLIEHDNTSLKVNGDAEFSGDIKIKGVSLSDTLEKISSRLAILHHNPDLEHRWDDLRELRIKYLQLEQELIDKEKMWNILKD